MNEIPKDVLRSAKEAIDKGEMAIVTVVNAIMAERTRADLAVWKELSGTPAYADAMELARQAIREPYS